MDHPASHDELLELAFQLAFFIHRDKTIALRIATAALEKLDTADSRQDKRRYYNPSGQRRKVSLPELLLLQRLVYAESERDEKLKEEDAGSPPSQATMVKHFIKHLVKITSRRNSFHVTLGLARLLHDFTTAETAELHNVVMQDADRVPEDAYYRSRKAVLMSEMKDRFGAMLAVERGQRGQERFRTRPDSHPVARLVRECLQAFTPWKTNCCVPDRFDPAMDELDQLAFRGNDPDEEHKTEVNRYHALLHPSCFERLALALGYDAPAARLAIPQFILATANQDDDADAGGGSSPKLSDEDRNSVRRYLTNQSGRRQVSTAGLLHFVVDGEALGTLNPHQVGETSFAIPRSAEFIEIRTVDREGELLLALHPLEMDQSGDLAEQQTEIELPGERSFRLSVTPARDAEGQLSGASVRATSLAAVRGIDFSLSPSSGQTKVRPTLRGWLKPALAFAVLAMIAAGLVYFLLGQSTPKPPVVTEASPTPAPLPSISPEASPLLAGTSPTPAPTRKPMLLPAYAVVAFNLPANPLLKEENLTRGQREEEAVTSLLAAKKLFVDGNGAPALAEPFAEALKERLQAGGTFNFSDKRDDAEIALKLIVESRGQRVRVIASIVNVKGEVLWPLTPGFRARRYDGVSEEVIAKLSRELLSDIQQLKQK